MAAYRSILYKECHKNSQKKSVQEYQLPLHSIGRLDLDKNRNSVTPEEAIKDYVERLPGELKWTDLLNCSGMSQFQLV